jgi:hypothetical protein
MTCRRLERHSASSIREATVMNGSWWATDVRDLISGGIGGNQLGRGAGAAVLHVVGDAVLGRAAAGVALKAAPLALGFFPVLLLGGAAVAAAVYFAGRPAGEPDAAGAQVAAAK